MITATECDQRRVVHFLPSSFHLGDSALRPNPKQPAGTNTTRNGLDPDTQDPKPRQSPYHGGPVDDVDRSIDRKVIIFPV